MSSFNSSRTSQRPTLPSIHSLDLPFMSRPAYDSYEKAHSSFTQRKASSSSSNTSMSRSPSPVSYSSREASPTHSTASSSSGRKLRLVPCAFEEADAVIVVPAPSTTTSAKPVMVMGSALQHLRGPQRPLARGSRMHPYRIAGSSSGSVSRRSSVASMLSLPGA